MNTLGAAPSVSTTTLKKKKTLCRVRVKSFSGQDGDFEEMPNLKANRRQHYFSCMLRQVIKL